MIEKLRKWIDEISTNPAFFLFLPRTDDPRWVIFCRLVMWGSIFSALGTLIAFQYIGFWYVHTYGYWESFLVLMAMLATASGISLYLYERKRMREWLVEELQKLPKERLLAIARKEKVSVKEDSEKSRIISQLMKELNRKVIEHHVFSDAS